MEKEKVYYGLISHLSLLETKPVRSISFIIGTSVAILDSRAEVG